MDFAIAFDDAKHHARDCFPQEAVGFIVDNKYIRLDNKALPATTHKEDDPSCHCQLCSFRIDPDDYARYATNDSIQYIVHSHPNGPFHPSRADMVEQVRTDVPWAIIPIDAERAFDPIIWGDSKNIPPLIGRTFVHGVTDCYSVIRDCFLLGKDRLAEQGIEDWPFEPIELAEVPRDEDWWTNDENDLYSANFERLGFVAINYEEAKAGDCFLLKVRSSKLNHAGVLLSDDLIIHHLPMRLSRREPAGIWGKQAGLWVRYVGNQPKVDNNA